MADEQMTDESIKRLRAEYVKQGYIVEATLCDALLEARQAIEELRALVDLPLDYQIVLAQDALVDEPPKRVRLVPVETDYPEVIVYRWEAVDEDVEED